LGGATSVVFGGGGNFNGWEGPPLVLAPALKRTDYFGKIIYTTRGPTTIT